MYFEENPTHEKYVCNQMRRKDWMNSVWLIQSLLRASKTRSVSGKQLANNWLELMHFKTSSVNSIMMPVDLSRLVWFEIHYLLPLVLSRAFEDKI